MKHPPLHKAGNSNNHLYMQQLYSDSDLTYIPYQRLPCAKFSVCVYAHQLYVLYVLCIYVNVQLYYLFFQLMPPRAVDSLI